MGKEQDISEIEHLGRVKWFHKDKGFGFIERDSGDEDVFVHYSGIAGDGYRELADGDRVEFQIGKGRNGRTQAVNVVVIT